MSVVKFSILFLLYSGCYVVYSSSRKLKENIIRIPIETHYKPITRNVNLRSKSQRLNIDLINGNNVGYSGIIYVGTPGQKMRVDFDTGSSDLWVASSFVCVHNLNYCKKHNLYDFTKSRTYENSFGGIKKLPYGSESDIVLISKDIFEIGPGLRIKQVFGQMIKTDITEENDPNFSDGIFGLSYPALGLISNSSNTLTNLVEQGVLKRALFAFFLNNATEKSELILGGYDPNHFRGSLTFTPVLNKYFWMIKIDSVLFGRYGTPSLRGIVDSGCTLILGPPQIVALIYNATGVPGNGQVIPCSSLDITNLPHITFVINKKRFVLTGKDYVMKIEGSTSCRSGFGYTGPTISPRNAFVLGDVFMRKFYTVFDMDHDRIGFAESL